MKNTYFQHNSKNYIIDKYTSDNSKKIIEQ